MAELTKEQQRAIDNYSKDIKTLKDFVTAVRKVPGMYIGSTSVIGVVNCIREIFQNSVDQILDSSSPANLVKLRINARTLEISVEDNGKGLPAEDIVRILTQNHTSKNFDKKPGQYSSGLHGSGSKIVNALSSIYIVESYKYDGTAVSVEFHKGYPTTKAPKKIKNPKKKQGLYTYFVPDSEVFGNIQLNWKEIYRLVKIIMSLTPIGSKCDLEIVDIDGKTHKEMIVNSEGIITDLIMKVSKPINTPIVLNADDGIHKLDLAFCYDAGEGDSGPDDRENITAFANFCPTLGGSHVNGVLEGICRWFSNYMNSIFLANQKAKNKIKVSFSDIKTGLNCMISAAHLNPVLTGQSKELLDNSDMIPFCKDVVTKGLDQWSKTNPQDLSKLCKFFKDVAELRMRNEAGKSKIVSKFKKNSTNNLPSKYIRPFGKKNVELIIVEGDSAKGTALLARDPQTQGRMMPHIVVTQCA